MYPYDFLQGPPGPPGPPGLPTRELTGVPSDKHKVTTRCFAKIHKELRAVQYWNQNIVQMCFYI